MRGELGDAVVERLFRLYKGRVPAEADLVVYWLAKAADAIEAGRASRAGLVTTNSVRGGANRVVMDRIADRIGFVSAWADEPWTVEGAAVRVSLMAFGALASGEAPHLNGEPVARINADLSATAVDLTKAKRLQPNSGTAFQGPVKVGPFEIDGDTARGWLRLPLNPNGRSNEDVLRPWFNGMDLARRPRDQWIIDFGAAVPEADAALYEAPFERVVNLVRPLRITNNMRSRREKWWLHGASGIEMRHGLRHLKRYIATPRVARHRFFVWLPVIAFPDSRLVVVARDDDTSFGVLHSRFHELWSLALGGWHGVGNDPQYTPSQGYETFPFPDGLTPNVPAASYADDPRALAIATAAARLNELRENWLNPADLVRREPEVVPGYPDRILPMSAEAAKTLQKRTLTNLYNERPAWLDHAHRALDAAVAAAYGWPADLPDEEVLARLFALNQERAAGHTVGQPALVANELAEVE